VNLNPTNQNGVVAYTVEVSVDNADNALLPGMTAYVTVILSRRENVLRVPATALRFVPQPPPVSGLDRLLHRHPPSVVMLLPGKNRKTIYVLRSGNLTSVPVKTGATDENDVEISGEGIAEGDTVVIGTVAAKR
jgi:HlyD family secretion protein